MDGLLLVHKPHGPTSHDVVQAVRRKLRLQRIGHGGTLDPMAEGLLILLVGKATKWQQSVQGHRKSYDAQITLGAQTETADADGRIVRTADVPALSVSVVESVLESLLGEQEQIPPAYSAIKVQGRHLYEWARRGKPKTVAPRRITLFSLRLLALEGSRIAMHLDCSSGTYVRALAETIAQQLGTVGHLSRLVRRSVGPWQLEHARPLASWLDAPEEDIERALLRPDTVAAPLCN